MDNDGKAYRGRIAPTPSGLLHIGHERTFRTAWTRARERGGKIFLRMEDIDPERCRPEYARAAIDDLRDAGFDWDGEPIYQSSRTNQYWEILKKLSKLGLVYPCPASRAQIKKLSSLRAPAYKGAEPETVFPVSLRVPSADIDSLSDPVHTNWRFKIPNGEKIAFIDKALGSQSFTAGKDFGDFLVWRKIGAPSYELAVVADDIAEGITEVVRGADLLVSTARQILIYRALGADIPDFYHCGLIFGEDGKKLSKSSLERVAENSALMRNRGRDGL